MTELRTEYPFTLPKGYVDGDGVVHRDGTMRLATARDELEPLKDPKIRDIDDPYLTIVVLSRVITRLGTHARVSPRDLEGLFAADLAHLQDVYSAINYGTPAEIDRLQGGGPTSPSSAPAPDRPATTPTPVSDAARDLTTPTLVPDPEPPPDAVARAPRRSAIEEVGRRSANPRGTS